MQSFIDLSIPIESGVASDPPGLQVEIEYIGHEQTKEALVKRWAGQLDITQLPDGEGYAIEHIKLTPHNGTHMDSPWHYSSTMEDGSRSKTIDEIPLEWCVGRGVKLDFRACAPGYMVTVEDMNNELARVGHQLKPMDIVLINTAAGARYGHDDYLTSGCGVSKEATHFLIDNGIRIAGTDAWSWDAPNVHAVKRFLEDRDHSKVLEGHKAGRKDVFCHMEKVGNLASLPGNGFTVFCFPVKIKGASGGWTRCVAKLDD